MIFNENGNLVKNNMTVEKYTIKQINTLITDYEKLEIDISIDDSSYSVDFFITNKGKRQCCIDLIDENIISNKSYEKVAKNIAKFARESNGYIKGKINKYHAVVNK